MRWQDLLLKSGIATGALDLLVTQISERIDKELEAELKTTQARLAVAEQRIRDLESRLDPKQGGEEDA